jgi:hypothetical protein
MDRPLLVSGPLIKPIQDEIKTETRRTRGLDVINDYPNSWELADVTADVFAFKNRSGELLCIVSPYGMAGDSLWIRENWFVGKSYDNIKPRDLPRPVDMGHEINHGFEADGPKPDWAGKTRPSIHMPRWMSRIEIELTGVTVERLHQITEGGAKREGVKAGKFRMGPNTEKGQYQLELNPHGSYVDGFRFTWAQLNGLASWDLNPWVWVLSFKLKKSK